SGKTTRIPPALSADGPVILLQPRRVAARSIARRIAEEQRWTLGETVGWQVRFERHYSRSTRLLVVTEGILTARLQTDPLLSGFRTAILDEFHERSIHADLALALLKQAALAREDLRIVVMSATLQAERVSRYLDGCPVIEIAAKAYPVDLQYDRDLTPATAVKQVLSRPGGHLLCFLPGAGEISQATAELKGHGVGKDVDILPLHGSLPSAEQDRALAPSASRKAILTTNIAETSLTVEGVTDVVDGGYHKVLRYDPRTGIDRLDLERIPADSAAQRAGRAGRQGPGRVLRLWDPRERLREHREPDILRIDLAGPFLQVIAWGGDPLSLDWFEPPPADQAQAALELLTRLSVIAGPRLTKLGSLARRLPLHPRLACLLVNAGASARAAAVCALLSDRLRPASTVETTVSDILSQADRMEEASPFAQQAAREIETVGRRLLKSSNPDQLDEQLLRAILAAYPDRVAKRREPGSDRLLLASGHGARLERSSGVREGEFLVAVDVMSARRGALSEASVRLASLVRKEWLQPTEVHLIHVFEAGTGTVKAFEQSKYGEILLSERPVSPHSERAAELLMKAIEESGLDPESRQLLQRAALAGVSVDVDAARRQACLGRVSLPRLDLKAFLPFDKVRTIDRLCPEQLGVPSGRKIRLEYREDGSVRLTVKLQEMFGLSETPRVGRRQEPVVIEMLAPNGRPVQTTSDLRSFWQTTYQEVRKELRGRYPKHPWPEDPWTTPATAGVKRKSGKR
ncbi:MAG: ATP-dependent helicase HrpB, partial [Acidobacteria bacterium]